MVKIHYATISETGKRKNNEDAFRMISMSDNNMSKEKNNLNVNVFGHEFEVHVPKGKEQLHLLAAEYVNKKIDAYMDAFVRVPFPQKSTQEMLLMAMLDIAVDAIECKQNSEHSSLLKKMKKQVFRI